MEKPGASGIAPAAGSAGAGLGRTLVGGAGLALFAAVALLPALRAGTISFGLFGPFGAFGGASRSDGGLLDSIGWALALAPLLVLGAGLALANRPRAASPLLLLVYPAAVVLPAIHEPRLGALGGTDAGVGAGLGWLALVQMITAVGYLVVTGTLLERFRTPSCPHRHEPLGEPGRADVVDVGTHRLRVARYRTTLVIASLFCAAPLGAAFARPGALADLRRAYPDAPTAAFVFCAAAAIALGLGLVLVYAVPLARARADAWSGERDESTPPAEVPRAPTRAAALRRSGFYLLAAAALALVALAARAMR